MITPIALSGFWYGLFVVIYIALLIFLGVTSLRKGHWIMFVIGIFFPLFWIIGAILPPTESARESGVE
ncbi:MAG: hypothetical protein FGM34_03175 [Solirubrobacteraceae bacterium]|nr:hypothetical protein [Solirubrobacteraceae bacterium]